jgi:hypothetical protein
MQDRQLAETSYIGMDWVWDVQWQQTLGGRMFHHTHDDLIASRSLHTPALMSLVGENEFLSTAVPVGNQISEHSVLEVSG